MDWPIVVQKVLSNDNYIVRRLNTNKTQILHRIRLKKFVPNTPLEDKYSGGKLQPDEEIVIPQDDLYTISWEIDCDYELFETRKTNWPDTATRLPSDAASGGVDYYVTENERCNAVEDEQCSSEQANENDITENERRPRTASSRDTTSPRNESPSGAENENDVTNDLESTENASNEGADITVPGISKNKKLKKILVLEERNIIFDLTPIPTFLMNTDTRKTCKLTSQRPRGPNDDF